MQCWNGKCVSNTTCEIMEERHQLEYPNKEIKRVNCKWDCIVF